MYKQVKAFDPKKMGKQKGYCLQNARLGFGVNKGYYASAKIDMETQKANGTLHSIDTLPYGCAVPVYCDTTSRYEHVVIYDDGIVYEDGHIVMTGLTNYKCFGWGELVDNERVVRWEDEEKPLSQIAQEVIGGFWGNGYERKKRLTNAGYDYQAVQELVNKAMAKNKDLVYTVKAGDNLTVIAKKYNTTVEKIAKDNHIKNVNLIIVGQKLVIK